MFARPLSPQSCSRPLVIIIESGDNYQGARSILTGEEEGKSKLKLFTFIDGVEIRAVRDGEKRGPFSDDPVLYYATARELVALVQEKAEGTSTPNSTNLDKLRIEILFLWWQMLCQYLRWDWVALCVIEL